MKEYINETFEMFKEYVYSPELKELIASIQEMYNQKEELQQRINKAIEYLKRTDIDFYGNEWLVDALLNILQGSDKE